MSSIQLIINYNKYIILRITNTIQNETIKYLKNRKIYKIFSSKLIAYSRQLKMI